MTVDELNRTVRLLFRGLKPTEVGAEDMVMQLLGMTEEETVNCINSNNPIEYYNLS